MDFEDSVDEAAYRSQVSAWLRANAPSSPQRAATEAERLGSARAWQAKKAAHGYARISWPVESGGAGGTAMQQVIFNQEEAKFDVPVGFFGIGLGMCIPTIQKYASEELQRRFVGPALRGEQIWCQLFSEPAAGSDVAGLRTRAKSEGDEWIINGQKVWTTGAHYSDYGLLLARSNSAVPKHRGLTMFWLDMKSAGVEVRPIHQMSGGSDFNEVYLTNVRIPDSQRLGAVGEGWKVALVTLMNERVEGGKDRGPSIQQILQMSADVPSEVGTVLNDAAFRQRLALWYVQSEGLRFGRMRTLTAISRGQIPGPESAIGKLVAATRLQELTDQLIECQDQFGLITDADYAALGGSLHRDYLHAPGLRIAGGTDEILRNVIAERILGMPGDIRVDKDIPFKNLPSGP